VSAIGPQTVLSPGVFPATTPGPDACDWGPSNEQPGGFYLVSIQPVGSVTRDVNGQLLHCVYGFPLTPGNHQRGARWAKGWSDGGGGSFKVESDPGTVYLTQGVGLEFTGGIKGDAYTVEIIQAAHIPTPEEIDDFGASGGETPIAFTFRLTSVNTTGRGIPLYLPLLHTDCLSVAGAITYDGVVLTPGAALAVPTNAIAISVGNNSISQTGGRF
jgi:hypothetical protein